MIEEAFRSPEPEHEPPFIVEALDPTSGDPYLRLECTRCLWIAEVESPVGLAALDFRAREHDEVCTGE